MLEDPDALHQLAGGVWKRQSLRRRHVLYIWVLIKALYVLYGVFKGDDEHKHTCIKTYLKIL